MNIDNGRNRQNPTQKKKHPIDEALKYLSYRDRTCQEMKIHLKDEDFTSDEMESTISYLLEMNYLNDKAYTERYIEYAISKGKGLLKIKGELVQKGIDRDLLEDMLSCSENLETQNERKRALTQALKIMESVKMEDYATCVDDFESKRQIYKELQRLKAKVARRLEGLGYSRDVIFAIIDEVFNK